MAFCECSVELNQVRREPFYLDFELWGIYVTSRLQSPIIGGIVAFCSKRCQPAQPFVCFALNLPGGRKSQLTEGGMRTVEDAELLHSQSGANGDGSWGQHVGCMLICGQTE